MSKKKNFGEIVENFFDSFEELIIDFENELEPVVKEIKETNTYKSAVKDLKWLDESLGVMVEHVENKVKDFAYDVAGLIDPEYKRRKQGIIDNLEQSLSEGERRVFDGVRSSINSFTNKVKYTFKEKPTLSGKLKKLFKHTEKFLKSTVKMVEDFIEESREYNKSRNETVQKTEGKSRKRENRGEFTKRENEKKEGKEKGARSIMGIWPG